MSTFTGNGRRALVGSLLHSVSLGELQIFDHGAIVFNPKGIIEKLYDLNDDTSRVEFELLNVPKHILRA